MTDVDSKKELSEFIKRKRKKVELPQISTSNNDEYVPWYKRPLEKNEFKHKIAKNGRYYVRHKEWHRNVWIGPYKDIDSVNEIIGSYVVESLKTTLEKKTSSNVHSVIIDNPEEFF